MSSNELSNTIVQHYAGSISYGTNLPTSDVDVRGIFCAEPEQIRTSFFPVKEYSIPNHEDGKLYELYTFMDLYLKGNPNILETLWVDDTDLISTDGEAYELLRQNREKLLSSNVAYTFSGYATSQLKRIKGHNKWINNPQPRDPPKHYQFLKMVQNFTDNKVMPRDFNLDHLEGFGIVHYGGNIFGSVPVGGSSPICAKGDFNISCKQDGYLGYSAPRFIFKYLPEEYKLAKEKHYNYWNWVNNRNKSRSELEVNFGYDTKHAMHLVRLLRMGEEILSGQGVIVKRPDAIELLDIRAGRWEYSELVEYAEQKDKYIRGELYKNTSLRKNPDIALAAKVVMECQDIFWGK